MNINYILYLIIFFIFVYFVFKKYEILQENVDYSDHKKLGKANKAPILIGGLFILTSLLVCLPVNLIFFKIASISIFLVGILSDKNIISSPKLRLFLQISVIFFLVHFESLNIVRVNIGFIDYLLNSFLISNQIVLWASDVKYSSFNISKLFLLFRFSINELASHVKSGVEAAKLIVNKKIVLSDIITHIYKLKEEGVII